MIDSGSSNIYLTINEPKQQVGKNPPTVRVGTAAGTPQVSSASCDLALPHLPEDFPKSGHVMPGFTENLIGIGEMCDAGLNSHVLSIRCYNLQPTWHSGHPWMAVSKRTSALLHVVAT